LYIVRLIYYACFGISFQVRNLELYNTGQFNIEFEVENGNFEDKYYVWLRFTIYDQPVNTGTWPCDVWEGYVPKAPSPASDRVFNLSLWCGTVLDRYADVRAGNCWVNASLQIQQDYEH
jgi:hypothetical protein